MSFQGASFPKMGMVRPGIVLSLAAVLFAGYVAIVPGLYARPRTPVSAEMEIAIPRFAQVLMAAGDRFLAADMGGFRALVASTENMTAENYRILGLVQSDISWFNPAHEDNYYIAAAILPWNGELEAAQRILKAASEARLFDWQPAFYYAFNSFHFLKDPADGAKWLRIAAMHTTDEIEKIQLQQVAALWAGKGDDLEFAIRMHRAMARETKHKSFANFLEKRAQRLENLLLLQRAIDRFIERTGQKATNMQQLVDSGILSAIPPDPFGSLYIINENGKPEVVQPRANRSAP